MKTVIVVNPAAGGGQVARRWRAYNASISRLLGPAEVCLTQHAGHATELTRNSLLAGFQRVVVVGGDGTLNECVNGLLEATASGADGSAVTLVLYPAGFGGDFARGVGLRSVPLDDALDGATDKWIDVGRANFVDHDGRPASRYFINIASFGASGQIIDRVNRSSKWLGGTLGFWTASARTLFDYPPQSISLAVDDGPTRQLTINTVAVANGSTFGSGMRIAPQARLDDGLLDVVTVQAIDLWRFIRHSRALYGGRTLEVPGIDCQRGRRVVAQALGRTPVLLELDGELPGRLPATFEVAAHKVRLYAAWERLTQGVARF